MGFLFTLALNARDLLHRISGRVSHCNYRGKRHVVGLAAKDVATVMNYPNYQLGIRVCGMDIKPRFYLFNYWDRSNDQCFRLLRIGFLEFLGGYINAIVYYFAVSPIIQIIILSG